MSFAFREFPVLETRRLRLREMTVADTSAIFAIRGDYEVTRYNIGAAYPHPDHARELIQEMTRLYHETRELRWGITLKADGTDTVIGMCGFNYWDRQNQRASIGFDLARAYWRQGIMREALGAVLGFGFGTMGLHRIEADAGAENAASIGLMTRLGFTQEGRQRQQYYEEGTFHDLVLFGLLRDEWERTVS